MRKSRFTEEQIVVVLKESEAGAVTKELRGRHGISEQTLHHWNSSTARWTSVPGRVEGADVGRLGAVHAGLPGTSPDSGTRMAVT